VRNPLAVTVALSLALVTVGWAAEPARFDPALTNVRLLTQNPGSFNPWDNAEAYFSPDGRQLVFQGSRDGRDCDAIYVMDVDGTDLRMVSPGTGRCTCAYFSPDGQWIVFASTHLEEDGCPPRPDQSQGYTWPVYDAYEIFRTPADGGQPERLTASPGYDAEAVYRPDGERILFTSTRDGDLEIYDMAPDGSDVRRLTHTPGYDGGAFYTRDSRRIVFRARHPEGEELEDYRRLLAQGLVRPGQLDLFVMDADGGNLRRVTHSGDAGATNWAPYPHPDGRRIVFASNRDDFDGTIPGRYGFNFELYLVDMDGNGLRRLTWHEGFDGFPMFSPDGSRLVWCGNYIDERPRDTDVLLADWVE
jgi:Tol biopolymer transport system component